MNAMINFFANGKLGQEDDAVCRRARLLLGAYTDNSLSARQAWEVEKHLALCRTCALISRQTQATVTLLHGAERRDTGDDFMARLHARLDDAAPAAPARVGVLSSARDTWERIAGGAGRRRIGASALGLAGASAVALALFVTHPASDPTAPAVAPSVLPGVGVSAHENSQRNVALTANDPLGDVAAEALENAETSGAGAPTPNSPAGNAAPGLPASAPLSGS